MALDPKLAAMGIIDQNGQYLVPKSLIGQQTENGQPDFSRFADDASLGPYGGTWGFKPGDMSQVPGAYFVPHEEGSNWGEGWYMDQHGEDNETGAPTTSRVPIEHGAAPTLEGDYYRMPLGYQPTSWANGPPETTNWMLEGAQVAADFALKAYAGYSGLAMLEGVLASYAPSVLEFMAQGSPSLAEAAATWAVDDAAIGAAVDAGTSAAGNAADAAAAGSASVGGGAPSSVLQQMAGAGDAIEGLDIALRETGAGTATEAAGRLGFSTTEQMLASVNPEWVTAGAAAAGGAAGTQAAGTEAASATTNALAETPATASGGASTPGLTAAEQAAATAAADDAAAGAVNLGSASTGASGGLIDTYIDKILNFAKGNKELTSAGAIVTGSVIKGAMDGATAKDLMDMKTQQAIDIEQGKRNLVQSGSYFDAKLPFAAPGKPRMLKRADGSVVYAGPGLIDSQMKR